MRTHVMSRPPTWFMGCMRTQLMSPQAANRMRVCERECVSVCVCEREEKEEKRKASEASAAEAANRMRTQVISHPTYHEPYVMSRMRTQLMNPQAANRMRVCV